MRRKLLCFVSVVLLLFSVAVPVYAGNGDVIVYVTDSGKKYHTMGCGYLKSSNPITLERAVAAGYSPCSRCHPPRLEQSTKSDIGLYQPPPSTSSKSSQTPSPAPSQNTAQNSTTPTPTLTQKGTDTWGILKIWGVCLGIAWAAFMTGKSNGYSKAHSVLETERTEYNKNVLRLEAENKQLMVKVKEENHLAQVEQFKLQMYERQRLAEARAQFYATYNEKPIRFLFCIPENASVADGGFPVVRGWKREDYWVYATTQGKCFHRRTCDSIQWRQNRSIRIWDAVYTLMPCPRCQPKTADFAWYTEMKNVIREAATHGFKVVIENEILTLERFEVKSEAEQEAPQRDNSPKYSISLRHST